MKALFAISSVAVLVFMSCIVSASGQYDITQYATTITLDAIPDSAHMGDTITFSGTLHTDDAALPNKDIHVCKHNPFKPDDCFTNGKTDSQGQFNIQWVVHSNTADNIIYVIFNGDDEYRSAKSSTYTLDISKHNGHLILDEIPHKAYLGDTITFSGTLNLESASPEGAIIHIKEKDSVNSDDLLGSAYVIGTGHFSTDWVVMHMDTDDTVEVYAVFEGGDTHHKMTTCDTGYIHSSDGSCKDYTSIQIMQISPKAVAGPVTTEEYIQVYRSLKIDSKLHIAIIPDSISVSHVTPIQGHITSLTSMLKNQYGGDWDIDFETIQRNDTFYKAKPDIIINVITPEDTKECTYHENDYSMVPKPIPVTICVNDTDTKEQTLHQFSHAIGLGHTFNTPNDNISDMSLAAIIYAYGADGFASPNNPTPDAIFTAKNYHDKIHLEPIPDGDYPSKIGIIETAPSIYEPGDDIHIRGWYWDEYSDMAAIIIIGPDNKIVGGFDTDIVYDHTGGVGSTAAIQKGILYDGFDKSVPGYHHSGTYKIRMYDDAGSLSASNAFEITGTGDSKDTPPDLGVIFTNSLVYMPGSGIHITGLYPDKYEGASTITITNSSGDIVGQIYADAADGTVKTYTFGYYTPGIYSIQLYDDNRVLVANNTFYISEAVYREPYTGEIFTDQTQYGPNDTMLISGFYDVAYDKESSVVISNQHGHIIDRLYFDVTNGSFSVETITYEDSIYTVALYDNSGIFVTDTEFAVTADKINYDMQISVLSAVSTECGKAGDCYSPGIVKVRQNDTVVWTNYDTVFHTITSGNILNGPDYTFDSGLISPDSVFAHTFDEPGTHSYFCLVHPWRTGTVIVE